MAYDVTDWMVYRDGEPYERIDRRGMQYARRYRDWLQVNEPDARFTVERIGKSSTPNGRTETITERSE